MLKNSSGTIFQSLTHLKLIYDPSREKWSDGKYLFLMKHDHYKRKLHICEDN